MVPHDLKPWCTMDMLDFLAALSCCPHTRAVVLFMRDICSPQEIKTMANRWRVAKLIKSGMSQREIRQMTGIGMGTINRVHYHMKHGTGAYNERMKWHGDRRRPIRWDWDWILPSDKLGA